MAGQLLYQVVRSLFFPCDVKPHLYKAFIQLYCFVLFLQIGMWHRNGSSAFQRSSNNNEDWIHFFFFLCFFTIQRKSSTVTVYSVQSFLTLISISKPRKRSSHSQSVCQISLESRAVSRASGESPCPCYHRLPGYQS